MAQSIGERIKELRIEQGLTLADLSERTNLSISYLSQVERDKTTPSLATLMSIARALNVGVRTFFETEAEVAYVVRAEGEPDHLPQATAAERLPLTPEGSNRLEVERVTLEPHVPPRQMALFAGEEFAFVLAGTLTVTVGGEHFTLATGDSIHYDALQPHTWSNPGDEPCVVIWARAMQSRA